jgi:hypothetical protein
MSLSEINWNNKQNRGKIELQIGRKKMSPPIGSLTRFEPVGEMPTRPPQNSDLLNLPPEIISRIGIQLSRLEIIRLSSTCTWTLSYPSYIEEQCKEEFRGEVRQIYSYAKKYFPTSPVEPLQQNIFNAIDDLTLQNTKETIKKIGGILMRFSFNLSPKEKEQLKAALKTEIFLHRFENAFIFLDQQLLGKALESTRRLMSLAC